MIPRRENERPLKEWLQIFTSSPQLRSRLYQLRIEHIWEETMSAAVKQYTRRLAVSDDVLTIYVTSAPLKAELHTMREMIATRINQTMGADVIREVRIL